MSTRRDEKQQWTHSDGDDFDPLQRDSRSGHIEERADGLNEATDKVAKLWRRLITRVKRKH